MANLKAAEKEKARYIYFTTSLNQATIARNLGVSERTLSIWVTEGNWRELKKLNYYSPDAETQQLYEELRTISARIQKRKPEERFPTKEELEARTKIVALINSLKKLESEHWRNVGADSSLSHLFSQCEDPNVGSAVDI